METKNKNIFWEALVLSIFIFGVGIFLGYLLEMNRTSQIISAYQQSELDLLDAKIQNDIFSLKNISCSHAINESIGFADRIYYDAKLLEKYESASQIGKEIIQQHKKYDLLRLMLWSNVIKIKEKCNTKLNIVVYFYEYQTEELGKKSMQAAFSKKLSQLKEEYSDKIILIPIAGNIEANSMNYLRGFYDIEVLPTILINEKIKISDVEGLKNITSYLV